MTINSKPKVVFVCVHNSCRSQMAEALAKLHAADVFEAYSAGTEINDRINPDAVRLIRQTYQVDMEKEQYSKLISDIPRPDIVVTMGCNVHCPYLPSKHREDWGLEDPTSQDDQTFIKTIKTIESKVLDLRDRILRQEIKLD